MEKTIKEILDCAELWTADADGVRLALSDAWQEAARLLRAAPDLLEDSEALLGELHRMGLADMPGDTFADLRNRIDALEAAIGQTRAEVSR